MPDDDWKDMLRDVLGDMPGFDPGLKKQMLRSLDEEDKKSAPPPPDPNVQYFEQERPDVRSAIAFHVETFGASALAFSEDDPILEAFVAETAVPA